MPLLTDKDAIRAMLHRDRYWSVYALGDLAPHMYDKCRWFTPDLTLVLHDYGTCILFAMGTDSLDEALRSVIWPVHLQVQEDALAELQRRADVTRVETMWRMAWRGAPPAPTDAAVRRLGSADAAAVEALYADGASTGESPDFFYPAMLDHGVFYGVERDGQLIAAAGTHLVSREEGAAAIGNIYTRRDARGRGHGRAVTTAVLAELSGLPTIGLNVRANNTPAIRLYESLGFVRHCTFFEALATAPRS